jgi:hypothetical protein
MRHRIIARFLELVTHEVAIGGVTLWAAYVLSINRGTGLYGLGPCAHGERKEYGDAGSEYAHSSGGIIFLRVERREQADLKVRSRED